VSQQPRARRKFSQALVSGLKDDARAPQTIVTEAPPAELPKPLPLPNVVAERAAAPPHPRLFMPPPDALPEEVPPPELPDPLRVEAKPPATASPLGNSTPRPQPLPFRPPPDRKPAAADAPPPELPDAPRAAAKPPAPVAPLAASTPRPQPLPFRPPPDRIAPQAAPPSIASPAPPVTSPAATGAESFAIASLKPSKFTEVPAPPESHAAGFSGAPELHPENAGTVSNEKAALVVPNLSAGGGVRDALPTVAPAPDVSARSRLLAELRSPVAPHPPTPAGPNAPSALRVSSAPDPRLEGRVVYAMAIQMPNVTSYSGSWMVWFAERIPQPGAPPASVRPPEPRHKVDPAYIRSAVDQRIEGIVRLAAVIGKDGHVDRIELLSGIDNRLDESAVEALGKWLFEPASRDGAPIEVDAIFEVPFHLAPKPAPKPSR
jgi:TonB family protein